jgi:prepilin-type N-terminal cleavage/methylation domain-containing protein
MRDRALNNGGLELRVFNHRDGGFTLMELMVVVVILSVLSVVAMTSYTRYKRSARRGEGVAAINDIRIKQETFFSVYQRYEDSTGGFNEEVFDGDLETAAETAGYYEWNVAVCPNATIAWCNLGWTPPLHTVDGRTNMMHFQFQTMGWRPGADAPTSINNTASRWVHVRARGLPQSNGNAHCVDLTVTNEVSDVIALTEQPCN